MLAPSSSEHARGRRIRGWQHHRDLRLHVVGQLTGRTHRAEDGEQAEVGDQHAADAVGRGSSHVFDSLDDLLLPARRRRDDRACRRARHRGRVPRGIGTSEEADLDTGLGCHACHRVELVVRLEEDAASLRDPVHAHVETLRLLRAPPRGTPGPSTLGISTLKCAPSGNRFSEEGGSCRSPPGSPIDSRNERVASLPLMRPASAQAWATGSTPR